jgi:hypothetical protein
MTVVARFIGRTGVDAMQVKLPATILAQHPVDARRLLIELVAPPPVTRDEQLRQILFGGVEELENV